MRRALCIAGICALLAGCAHAHEHVQILGISTLERRGAIDRLAYSGRWDFVSHRNDGRYEGASARAFQPGASMSIVFRGTRLRIYGIAGRNGGRALALVAGGPSRTLDFYARHERVHVMLFDSGPLRDAIHSASLVVVRPSRTRARGYVNVDELEVDR